MRYAGCARNSRDAPGRPCQCSASQRVTSAWSSASVMPWSPGADIAFTPDRGRAEQLRARSCAAQIEVRGMRPGEGDAAVHLDAIGGAFDERIGAGEGRKRQCRIGIIRAVGQRLRGVACRRGGAFAFEQEVGGHVLDRLKTADRAAELVALRGIVDRHLQHPPRPARLFAPARRCRYRAPSRRRWRRRCGGRARRSSHPPSAACDRRWAGGRW